MEALKLLYMFHEEIHDVEGLKVENIEVEPQVTDASPEKESKGSCQAPDQDDEQAGKKLKITITLWRTHTIWPVFSGHQTITPIFDF